MLAIPIDFAQRFVRLVGGGSAIGLMLAGLFCLPAASAGEPVATPPDEPLILEFEYCDHFELAVHEGERFHAVAESDDVRTVIDGRILSVEGETCRLTMWVHRYYPGGTYEGWGTGDPTPQTLRIGEPPYLSMGATHSSCMSRGPWVRRGIDPVPSLVAALRRGGDSFFGAITEFERLGPRAAAAVPALVDALEGRITVEERFSSSGPESAAEALGRIGPAARAAVPPLRAALRNDDAGLRLAAAVALFRIDQHPDAVPELARLLTNPDHDTRLYAALALKEIGPGAPEAAAALKGLLADDRDPWMRQRRAEALWRVARDPDVIAIHRDALESDDRALRQFAASLLGEIGPMARDTIPALVRFWTTNPRDNEQRVAAALRQIDPGGRQSLAAFVAAVRRDPARAGAAGSALGDYGRCVLPPLEELARGDDPALRRMAFTAFCYVGGAAVPVLADLVEDDDPRIRALAAQTLQDLAAGGVTGDDAPAARGAIPALVRTVRRETAQGKNAPKSGAGAALVEMRSAAIPALRHLLSDENANVREVARHLLDETEGWIRIEHQENAPAPDVDDPPVKAPAVP